MSRRRFTRAVHLQGTTDARAVCGYDWMANLPRADAVPWTRRDKATCKKCLRIAEQMIESLPSLGEAVKP